MPEGINGIDSLTSSAAVDLTDKTSRVQTLQNEAKGANGTSGDEDGLVSVSLDGGGETSAQLKTELDLLKTEIDNLTILIESNEQIKQMYEKQMQEYKAKYNELIRKAGNEDDPEAQGLLRTQASSFRGLVQSLSSQISSISNMTNAQSSYQLSLQGDYTQTATDYNNALRAEAIAAARAAAASANSSPSFNTQGSTTAASNTVPVGGESSGGASSGHVSQNALNAIKNWEGLRTTAYKCPAGVWTIGYGHTSGVSAGQTISEAQAEQYLRQDLQSFENEVTRQAQSQGVTLTQGQFDALVSFAYNCGGGALQKSGIIGMIKSGNVQGASDKLNQYVHGGGKVLPGLVTRRQQESSWLFA